MSFGSRYVELTKRTIISVIVKWRFTCQASEEAMTTKLSGVVTLHTTQPDILYLHRASAPRLLSVDRCAENLRGLSVSKSEHDQY
jgi:hypothetical protein